MQLFQNYTDFDECCKDKHIDCFYQENRRDRFQYSFFCGNSRECYFYNYKPALQLAKYNVENHYAVVGLAEDMELTIKIMEKYLPRYFKNAAQIYNREHLANFSNVGFNKDTNTVLINKNPHSKPVQNSTRKLLMNHPVFKLEYDFYNFVKQRLYVQAKHLGLQ